MIPAIYRAATWRNTSPATGEHIGIGFETDAGTILRLKLTHADAKRLAETLIGEIFAAAVRELAAKVATCCG